jgi:hypothetical protein
MSRRDGGRLRERASPPGEPPAVFDRPAPAIVRRKACGPQTGLWHNEGAWVMGLTPEPLSARDAAS